MTLTEALCYFLNIEGRDVRSKVGHFEKNKHSEQLLHRYKSIYKLTDETYDIYINKSGTFLNRYANSINFIDNNFPRDFFTGKTVLEIGSGRGPVVLYLAKEKMAGFVYGVELEKSKARFSEKMLLDHNVHNTTILNRDMASVPELSDNSVDIIISIASFEHIMDLPAVLREAFRVLRPGGCLHSSFSPIWRHYYGSHLGKEIPFPWTHLLFNEPTVRKTLEKLQNKCQEGLLYQGLNKLTIKDYKKIISECGFDIIHFKQISLSTVLRILRKIPVINEFYAGSIMLELHKPASDLADFD